MPIVKGIFILWRNCNDKTEVATITAAQLNIILTNVMKTFGPDELQCLQSKALNPNPVGATDTPTVVPTELSLMQTDGDAEDVAPHPLTDRDPTEDNAELYDTILVTYNKFKQLPLCDWQKIEKLRWNTKSKQQTACAKKEAGTIAEDLNISTIQDLNTLYYAVAITVNPPKPELDNPVPKEPALPYKEKLEKRVKIARKLVGQLTDLKWKGNPDPNHHLLKGKDVFEALTTTCMRLAAAASKLQKYLDRTKRNKNNR
eukprot:10563975-Ditylum_brightwellii.AAC.1